MITSVLPRFTNHSVYTWPSHSSYCALHNIYNNVTVRHNNTRAMKLNISINNANDKNTYNRSTLMQQ